MSAAEGGKTAVILSGGGAYGAYEAGVLKALFRGESPATNFIPLEPDIYTGTSVGAFNAAVLTMHGDKSSALAVRILEEIWLGLIAEDESGCGNGVYKFRGNPAQFLNPGCYAPDPVTPFAQFADDALFYAQTFFTRSVSFALSQGNVSHRALQFLDLSAFISVDPFRITLERVIEPEAVRNSNKLLRVIATNWDDGDAKVFDNQDIGQVWGRDIVRASAAIPGIFPPVKVTDIPFVDGGVVMNTPLKPAIEADADILHVIYLDPDVRNIPLRRLSNTLDTIDRVYTIMQATKMNEDLKFAERINKGLAVIEKTARAVAEADVTKTEMEAFIRTANIIQSRLKAGQLFRKLVIHRYHPQDDIGGGLGMLDFHENSITRLIERGFNDAAYHDCGKNQCILP